MYHSVHVLVLVLVLALLLPLMDGVIILYSRAFGELQIWIRHFPDSRSKRELNNGDKKQEGGGGASTTEGLKSLCGLAVMFVFL